MINGHTPAFPVLNQREYPPLWALGMLDGNFFPVQTGLGHVEMELVLGLIAKYARHAGSWQPVSYKMFLSLAHHVLPPEFMHLVVRAVRSLAYEGQIRFIHVEHGLYMIPSPAFVRRLANCSFGYLAPRR